MKNKIYMNSMFDLTGKLALITGSSGGLGATIAKGLGKAGARVIINGRDIKKVEKTVKDLQRQQIDAIGKPFDITKENQVKQAINEIEKKEGFVDILINNAGIQRRGSLETIEKTTFQEVIDIHITGAFLVSKNVVKSMIERRKGKIINICSLMSDLGRNTVGPYAAAKGGLKMLTRAMTVDWAQYNIQINGIGPGYFITEMTQALADDQEFDSWLKKRTPAGRWGKPEELIGTAVYLASDASHFVNGQIIYVDGGILASL